MSVPDHELDEPDPDICEYHGRMRPCGVCRWDHLEMRAEMLREEREDER